MEPAASVETEPERLSTCTAESAALARTLFAILVSLCNQERAVNILVNVERHRTDFQQLQTFVNDFLTGGPGYNSAGILSGATVTKCEQWVLSLLEKTRGRETKERRKATDETKERARTKESPGLVGNGN